jgi:hypothetical protein
VFGTDDPTQLGIGWGVIATWWVGMLFGVPLAVVARAGSRPKRSAQSLVRPVAGLLAVMAVCAIIAGVAGWLLAASGAVFLVGPIADKLPADRHIPFLADLWAHSASYLVGLIGAVVVIALVWRSRGRAARAKNADPSPAPGLPQRRYRYLFVPVLPRWVRAVVVVLVLLLLATAAADLYVSYTIRRNYFPERQRPTTPTRSP